MSNETRITYSFVERWETVDHFKVNRWMLKLGAKWTLSEKKAATGQTGFGDQWELDGMVVTQKQAAKWYLATHKRSWWRLTK